MNAVNVKVYTTNESQLEALKAVMKALKIKFEVSKSSDKPYNPEFVNRIKVSKKQIELGQYTDVNQSDIESFVESL